MERSQAKEFIRSSVENGVDEEEIKNQLLSEGFVETTTRILFKEIEEEKIEKDGVGKIHEEKLKTKPLPKPNPEPGTEAEPEKKPKTKGFFTGVLKGERHAFWFLIVLLIVLVRTGIISFQLLKHVRPWVENFSEKVDLAINEIYPEELTINIDKGRVSTNVTEPYYITISQSDLEKLIPSVNNQDKTLSKIRLLAIDTKGKAEEFERYQSMYLLTGSSLVSYNDDGEITIRSLRQVGNMEIDQEFIRNKFNEINKNDFLTNLVENSIYIIPAVLGVLGFIGLIFQLLFTTLWVKFIVRIKQMKIKFGPLFKLTVLISFPVLIFKEGLSLIGEYSFMIQFFLVNNILILGIAAAILGRNDDNF